MIRIVLLKQSFSWVMKFLPPPLSVKISRQSNFLLRLKIKMDGYPKEEPEKRKRIGQNLARKRERRDVQLNNWQEKRIQEKVLNVGKFTTANFHIHFHYTNKRYFGFHTLFSTKATFQNLVFLN